MHISPSLNTAFWPLQVYTKLVTIKQQLTELWLFQVLISVVVSYFVLHDELAPFVRFIALLVDQLN